MKSRQFDSDRPADDLHPQARLFSPHDDVTAIRWRIAKAEKDRDAWKMSGAQERYLEAYFLVEALELQLGERLRTLRSLR